MPLDVWASVAQVATFVVIAVTAIAGLIQLRHLRASNQVAGMQTFFQMYEGAELRDAFHFVRTELERRLEDPSFREELRSNKLDRSAHPEIQICNFFDQWGGYYRIGVIDRRAFMRHNAGVIATFWDLLAPIVALEAAYRNGVNTSFEHFDYLAVQARAWTEKHPHGDYPKNLPRLPLVDPRREIDRRKP
jgi:hypothetical protein